MDCLFCSIAKGEIPSQKVYEDENLYAFYDIAPQAPTHFLVIPKEHIESSNCGKQAQQSVPHLHFHVLAGRDMTWPPG